MTVDVFTIELKTFWIGDQNARRLPANPTLTIPAKSIETIDRIILAPLPSFSNTLSSILSRYTLFSKQSKLGDLCLKICSGFNSNI